MFEPLSRSRLAGNSVQCGGMRRFSSNISIIFDVRESVVTRIMILTNIFVTENSTHNFSRQRDTIKQKTPLPSHPRRNE